jgi:hypothetical protein
MHSIPRFYNPVMHPVKSNKEEVLSNKENISKEAIISI